MKKLIALAIGSTALLLSVTLVGAQQLAGQSTMVSDQEASLLYGGACEGGHKYTTGNRCGEYGRDDRPFIGCRYKTGAKDEGAGGSYVPDPSVPCGVTECGELAKAKPCAT